MTKFDELLAGYRAGDKTSIEQFKNLFKYLNDREITIIRLFYGINCSSQSANEICDYLGLKEDQINQIIQKTTAKCVMVIETHLTPEISNDSTKNQDNLNTQLKYLPAFKELKSIRKFAGPLAKYAKCTLAQFVEDYNDSQKQIQGKEVYDKLMAAFFPEYMEKLNPKLQTEEFIAPSKYSMEDLLCQPKRLLPYVSNMHQSIGKLMDAAISQAISITIEHYSKPTNANYGKALQLFFKEHLDKNEISKRLDVTKEHVRKSMIGNFITGEDYVEDISIYKPFKQDVINLMNSLSYHACDSVFEENDIDTPEKREFACALAGKDFFNNMIEWGDAFVVTEKECVGVTKQHLASLKLAICKAIVPVILSDLIERTKKEFINNYDPALFNPQIIESFVESHPWIEKDDEDRYYILTPHLTAAYQRQGRIIYEEGGLIHYNKVKTIYESIYGETYKTDGVQTNMLKNRPEHDFFPYGKTGQWYYSEDSTEITIPNKAISEFVDKHIIFYWKDLADVVNQLLKVNLKLNKRRIRLEITNLCYTDKANQDHFVKKGEEDKYPQYSWNKGKQTRTNWVINHAYELLKDAPGKKMSWIDFEKQFKDDVIETGRPLKVIEDIKYRHSGTADKNLLFIRENDYISINEDVLQNTYNNDLSMVGLYRKYPEYYSVLFSLAMTELRKQPDNKMLLTDFITLAVNNIESDNKVVNGTFVRKVFSNNENLPEGLSRYNDDGSVYIKLDIVIADEQEKDVPQYEVISSATDDSQVAPTLVVSEKSRQPVTYTTRYNLDDVKTALRKDLDFYNRWVDGFTADLVIDKFIDYITHSDNNNLNDLLPQIIYEYHYARY